MVCPNRAFAYPFVFDIISAGIKRRLRRVCQAKVDMVSERLSMAGDNGTYVEGLAEAAHDLECAIAAYGVLIEKALERGERGLARMMRQELANLSALAFRKVDAGQSQGVELANGEPESDPVETGKVDTIPAVDPLAGNS